jgi:hypothetical protein
MYPVHVTGSLHPMLKHSMSFHIYRPVCGMFLQNRVYIIENTNIFVFVGFPVGLSVILRTVMFVEVDIPSLEEGFF